MMEDCSWERNPPAGAMDSPWERNPPAGAMDCSGERIVMVRLAVKVEAGEGLVEMIPSTSTSKSSLSSSSGLSMASTNVFSLSMEADLENSFLKRTSCLGVVIFVYSPYFLQDDQMIIVDGCFLSG